MRSVPLSNYRQYIRSRHCPRTWHCGGIIDVNARTFNLFELATWRWRRGGLVLLLWRRESRRKLFGAPHNKALT